MNDFETRYMNKNVWTKKTRLYQQNGEFKKQNK